VSLDDSLAQIAAIGGASASSRANMQYHCSLTRVICNKDQ
jgi:hypothetical protein